jgi:glycosyltransferase involved in cell wall biosynthesis
MAAFPVFSVIIPAYNYAEYLPSAIASVLAQGVDSPDLEIIVVDDGSTDATPGVAAAFKHPEITYIRQENAGLASARNAGLAIAKGEYVVFLDADDLLGPGYLQAQAAFLRCAPQVDIAVTLHKQFVSLKPEGLFLPFNAWPLCREVNGAHWYFRNIAPVHAFMIRRECVIAKGLWYDASLRACEDYDLWFRAHRAGLSFASHPGGVVFYRRHASSLSINLPNQARHDRILLRGAIEALFADAKAHETGELYGRFTAALASCLYLIGLFAPLSREEAAGCAKDELARLAGFYALGKGLMSGAQDPVAAYYEAKVEALCSSMLRRATYRNLLGRKNISFLEELNRAGNITGQPSGKSVVFWPPSQLGRAEFARAVGAFSIFNASPARRGAGYAVRAFASLVRELCHRGWRKTKRRFA